MRELVIRRGKEFFEVREREEPDSKFKTTKIPCYPVCEKPAACRWCEGMQIGPTFVTFPFSDKTDKNLTMRHVVVPAVGCHLVAFEWCEAHPNQPIRAGWLLTSEEVEDGRTGNTWPEDV